MDLALSSSLTFEPPSPSLLLRSQTTSPHRSRANNISTQRSAQRSPPDIFIPPPPPVDMDINHPVPSAAPNTLDQDVPMVDEETSSNQHVINTGDSILQQPQQEELAETSILDAPVEGILAESLANVNSTSQQEDQNAPDQNLDDQPPTMSEQVASPETLSTLPAEGQDSANPDEPDYSETSSDDDSDYDERPSPEDFRVDTSTPEEEEMKEIESKEEVAATDHGYFEKLFFHEMDDPEHVPEEVFRIDWTVRNVRGTYDHPNRRAVMKSPPVSTGGLEWRIKFYPRGNHTDHLSVYIEVKKPNSEDDHTRGLFSSSDETSSEAAPPSSPLQLPAEQSTTMVETPDIDMTGPEEASPEREDDSSGGTSDEQDDHWEVAVQFGIVMYNPSEPRVHVSQGQGHRLEHRFCSGSTDWGCTRFYGPHGTLWKRQRGQRQAMFQDDTLAFTAYVRIIKDDTQMLFRNPVDAGPWDSLAKTGLRGLTTRRAEDFFAAAAIASWALLRPFRDIIQDAPTVDPQNANPVPPKGLVIALQRTLHRMQTQQKPFPSPVSLAPVIDFFRALGIYHNSTYDLGVYDVVKFWELLRSRLQKELEDTVLSDQLGDIFDGSLERKTKGKRTRDVMTVLPVPAGQPPGKRTTTVVPISAGQSPSLRLPIKKMKSVQEALSKYMEGDDQVSRATFRKLPKFMHVELERQKFNEASRKWERVVDRVKMDETVDLTPWAPARNPFNSGPDVSSLYTLYGVIVHEGDLRSSRFRSILRPGGPGTRWYAYIRDNDVDKVVCQTQKQAIENNEGVDPGMERDGLEPVVYVVMYVRNDVVGEFLQGLPDRPPAPDWIQNEAEVPVTADPWTIESDKMLIEHLGNVHNVRIYRSHLFPGNTGAGVFDLYKASSTNLREKMIINLKLRGTSTIGDVKRHLDSMIPGIESPHQCHLFRFDATAGALARPSVRLADSVKLAMEKLERSQTQFWLHITPPGASNLHQPLGGDPESPPLIDLSDPTDDDPSPNAGDTVHQESEIQASDGDDFLMSDAPDMPATNDDGHTEGLGREAFYLLDFVANAHDHTTQPWVTVPSGLWLVPQVPFTNDSTLTPQETIYFFLKRFNPKEQIMRAVGSYIVNANAVIGPVVCRLLVLPEEYGFTLSAEEPDYSVKSLNREGTFSGQNLSNGVILIVTDEITDVESRDIREAGGMDDTDSYLSFCARQNLNEGIHPMEGYISNEYFTNMSSSGQTKNGLFHGLGTFTDLNGNTYDGNFVAGRRDGNGWQHFQNDDDYNGDWKDDRMDGEGTMVYAKTGNTYVGGFLAGRRHGRGRMDYKVAEDEEQLCQICYEEDIDCLFYDCGHVCACIKCARQLETCPVCRKPVKAAVKMYRT
ncbi:MAG: hypothetical protein M1816_002503 [Peltula sp. TS41687]|nr:MAG: hypothetical protein M1816_002503 [Peltula sp. TS41687]